MITLTKIIDELKKFPQKKSDIYAQAIRAAIGVSMATDSAIVELAELANCTDEQWYLDWEDFINGLSVKDHSIQKKEAN